jgi:hypothetical protein
MAHHGQALRVLSVLALVFGLMVGASIAPWVGG